MANCHLPYGDGIVYWDVHDAGGGRDRISKGATPEEYEGAWQHWAFTKDADAGEQNIYLNGVLWHSGTGLTRAMTGVVTAFSIGCRPGNLTYGYAGLIDDFRLYDRALTQEKITAYSEDTADAANGQSIQLQPAVAKKAGYEGTVAEELMAADYVSELMTGVFGQSWFLAGRMSLAFLRPALCGDTLTTNGRVTERIDQGSVTRRVYQVWCQNQRGETVALGAASGLLPTAGQP